MIKDSKWSCGPKDEDQCTQEKILGVGGCQWNANQNLIKRQVWRLIPVILATWEAEIWRTVIRDQLG
jgi:hypothetical protein